MFRKPFRSIASRFAIAALTCLLCIFSSAFVSSAIAHALGQSYLYFHIGETAVETRVEMTVRDLNEVLGLGWPANKKVRDSDIEPHLEQIKAYVSDNLAVGSESQTYDLVFQQHSFLNTTFAQFLQLRYVVEGFQALPDSLGITYDVFLAEKPQHTNLVLIEQNWKTGTFANESNASLIYADPGQAQTLDISGGSVLQGVFGVVRLGVGHILSGIDHVLFLAALLLPSVFWREAADWKPVGKLGTPFVRVLKLVTAFSVVHTLALGLGLLQVVAVPLRLVESVTAAAIGLAAVEIFYPVFKGWIWFIVAAFALFHGLGITDELIQNGAMSQYLPLSLLGFNLGIEIGQIVIVAVAVPLLYLLRTQRLYPRYAMPAGGALLGAMSLYWFIEYAFNVNIRVLPFIQGLF
ncbi:MAG: HupE/UreJ family protein [Cyanobacteria bacterium P01_A01_bin.123]